MRNPLSMKSDVDSIKYNAEDTFGFRCMGLDTLGDTSRIQDAAAIRLVWQIKVNCFESLCRRDQSHEIKLVAFRATHRGEKRSGSS